MLLSVRRVMGLPALVIFFAFLSLQAEEVLVIEKGGTPLPIVISPSASEATRELAKEFAAMLGKMTGAEFPVTEAADPAQGVLFGTLQEFPGLAKKDALTDDDPLRREEYLLRSEGQKLTLLGATSTGLAHAMWDVLHRWGYRHYFPQPEWEIIPRMERLAIEVDTIEKPDYIVRNIWFGFGAWPENRQAFHQWQRKNRMSYGDAFELKSGHTYDGIVNTLRKRLEEDPALLSRVDGKPTNKLNAGNPSTLKATIEAKLAEVAKALERGQRVDSVSMDPSDGGGWGDSPEELAIGTPSDRVVYLANQVLEALHAQFGRDIYAGTYAYHMHYPPPTKQKVDPRLIVSFATAFTTGNLSMDETMEGWRNAGMKLAGIREYYSVHAWDRDLPASGRAADLDYITRTIPDFYRKGARFMSSESGDNWGPHGLGYYLASRYLWDVDTPLTPEALLSEFVANCFPEAKGPMARFYREAIHPSANRRRPLNPDLLGRMYRSLQEALQLTSDPVATQRLHHLILYTRHLENVMAQQKAPRTEREELLAPMLMHSWRMRSTQMTHTLAQWRSATDRYRRPESEESLRTRHWQVPVEKNPWKNEEPFSEEEIQSFVSQGVAAYDLVDFEPVSFSNDLVPATGIPALKGLDEPVAVTRNWRASTPIYTLVDDAAQPLEFNASGGHIYQMFGDAKFELFEAGTLPLQKDGEEPPDREALLYAEAVDQAQIAPDKTEQTIRLQPRKTGLHVMRMSDRAGGTRIAWPVDRYFTLESSTSYVNRHMHRFRFYFYVPKGTKVIGGFAMGNGNVWGPDKSKRLALPGGNAYVQIPVGDGEDGQCWQFEGANGTLALMTVPPYIAPTISQLLLPREVVEADGKGGL